MKPYDQTAILFFSRSPRQEALHKQLAGPHSYQVSKILLQHSVRELRKTKLPVHACLGPQQIGDTFGERLANATETVFAQGYKQVIIVGSDSPGLKAQTLKDAQARLAETDVVLGPSSDGGVYLIGLKHDKYDRERFVALDWETEWLQASVEEYLGNLQASSYMLPTLVDLDTAANFADWYPNLSKGRLLAELQNSLAQNTARQKPIDPSVLHDLQVTTGIVRRRGPPTPWRLRA